MSEEISKLVLVVDAQQVEKATTSLDELAAAGARAERSSGRMASSYSGLKEATNKMTGSTRAAAVDTKKLDMELTSLLSRINPTYAGVKQLDSGMDTLHQSLKAGLISQTQYASSVTMLESTFARTTKETVGLFTMTDRARMGFVQLGRQMASGNISQMPLTLARIAMGINPILLGVFGVTAALGVGAYAWYKWGESASESLEKAEKLENLAQTAADAASSGVTRTSAEQLKVLQNKMASVEGELTSAISRRDAITGKTGAFEAQAVGATVLHKREELAALQRQVDQVQAASPNTKALEKTTAAYVEAKKKAEEYLRTLEKEAEQYGLTAVQKEMLNMQTVAMTLSIGKERDAFVATSAALIIAKNDKVDLAEATKKTTEAQKEWDAILGKTDSIEKATQEWEKLLYLQKELGLSSEEIGAAYAKIFADSKDTAEKSSAVWTQFTQNVQSSLGNVLYDQLNGKFTDIGELFKQMLLRMAADAVAANIAGAMFGQNGKAGIIGAILKGLGGGATSGGTASGAGFVGPINTGTEHTGGIVGFAGASKLVHPAVFEGARRFHGGGIVGDEVPIIAKRGEGVFTPEQMRGLSPAGGMSINNTTVVNIDSRTDRAEVDRIIAKAVQRGNVALVDKLQRQGVI